MHLLTAQSGEELAEIIIGVLLVLAAGSAAIGVALQGLPALAGRVAVLLARPTFAGPP